MMDETVFCYDANHEEELNSYKDSSFDDEDDEDDDTYFFVNPSFQMDHSNTEQNDKFEEMERLLDEYKAMLKMKENDEFIHKGLFYL